MATIINHNQRPAPASSRSAAIRFMLAQRPCSAQIPPPIRARPASAAMANALVRSQRVSTIRSSVGASASASIGNIGIR